MTIDEKATRAALARIEQDGSDLSRELEMDFFVSVSDWAAGSAVARGAEKLGVVTNVYADHEGGRWTCQCTLRLVPTLADVLRIERFLDGIGQTVGGWADGFGTFGNGTNSDDEDGAHS